MRQFLDIHTRPAPLRWMILFVLLLLSLPSSILAEPELQLLKADLTNITQESVEKADSKATMRLYFSAVYNTIGDPLRVVDVEGKPDAQVKLERDKVEVEAHISSMSLKDFKDGDLTVAVMVVFPNALIHYPLFPDDGPSAIGPAVADHLVSKLRDQDEVGAIGYGNDLAQSLVFTLGKDNAKPYTLLIRHALLVNGDQTRPNVYAAIEGAAAELKSSKADIKYLIIIADGQGRTAYDAQDELDNALEAIKTQDLRPFIIMYAPAFDGGPRAEDCVRQLQGKGYFTKAETEAAFEKALQRAVAHIYDQHHILEVTYDLKEKWIDPGPLKIEFTADRIAQTRSINAEWPKLVR